METDRKQTRRQNLVVVYVFDALANRKGDLTLFGDTKKFLKK
jgi:hypothetical protein